MTKRFLSIIVAIALLMTISPASVFAADSVRPYIETNGFPTQWQQTHAEVTITAKDDDSGVKSMTVNGVPVQESGMAAGGATIQPDGTPYYKLKQIAYDEEQNLLTMGLFIGNVQATAGQFAFQYDTQKMDPYDVLFEQVFDETLYQDSVAAGESVYQYYYTAYARTTQERTEYDLTPQAYFKSVATQLLLNAPAADRKGAMDLDTQKGVGYVSWLALSTVVDATQYELPLLKLVFKLKDSVTIENLDASSFTVPSVSDLDNPSVSDSASMAQITVEGNPITYRTEDGTMLQAYTINGKTYGDGSSAGEFIYRGSTQEAVNHAFVVHVEDNEGNVYDETIPVLVDDATTISAPDFHVSTEQTTITVSDFSVATTPLSGVTYSVALYEGRNILEKKYAADGKLPVVFEGQEDKTYSVVVTAISGTGITNTTQKTVTIEKGDTTGPVIQVSGVPEGWSNQNVTLVISAEDVSGIKAIYVGGEVLTGSEYIVSANGENNLHITAIDNKDNESTKDIIVKIDKELPILTVSDAPTLPCQTYTFTLNAQDNGGSGLKSVTVNGTDITNQQTYQISNNGTYTFIAEDNAGNQTEVVREVTNIDNTKPQIQVTGNPTEWTNQTQTILIETDETCRIQADGAELTASGTSAQIQVENNKTIRITATDLAGNVEEQTVVVDKIDKMSPQLQVTGEPTEPCQEVQFIISADDAASGIKSVTVNSVDITGQKEYTVTQNGVYNFVATDNAGNTQSYQANITLIDNELPVIQHSYDSAAGWTNQSITIQITVDKSCRITVGEEILEEDATTAQFVAEYNGVYTVKAEDAAGNTAQIEIVVGNIDRQDPTAQITVSQDWAKENVITIAADDGEGSGIRSVMVDGQEAVGSNGQYKAIVTENKTYTVQITDYAGNLFETTAEITKVDTTAPELQVSDVPSQDCKSFDFNISAIDTQSGVKKVTVDGVDITGQSVYTADQNKTYTFVAEDNAGNTTTVQRNVTVIDNQPPTILQISGNPTQWTNQSAQITITTDEACTVTVDGVLAAQNATQATFTAPANKAYAVVLTDAVGNEIQETIIVDKIDLDPPQATATYPTEWCKSGEIILQVSDGLSGIREVTYNNAPLQATDGRYVLPITANGEYVFVMSDLAGNTDTKVVVVDKIDNVPPQLELSVDNGAAAKSRDVVITYSDTESGVASVTVNGEAYSGVSGSAYTATSNGIYEVVVTDNAGNEVTKQVTVENVDSEAPVFDGEIIINEVTIDSATVTLPTATDINMVTYQLLLNDQEIPYEQVKTLTGLSAGNVYNITLRATDSVGNTAETSKQFATTGVGSVSVELDLTGITTTEVPLKMTATVNGITKDIGVDGKAVFDNLPAGQYTVKMEGQGYITFEKTEIEVVANETTVVAVNTEAEFLAGDVISNGVIDIFDLNAVASNFVSEKYANEALIRFDLNRDGVINEADVLILVKNVLKIQN